MTPQKTPTIWLITTGETRIQPNRSMHLRGTKNAHNREEIRGPAEISVVIRGLLSCPQILFPNLNFQSWNANYGTPGM